MKHLLFIAIFIASCIGATAQQVINLHTLQPAPAGTSTEPHRTVEQLDGAVRVTYTFSHVYVDSTSTPNGTYIFSFDGFGQNSIAGTPAIPLRMDAIAVGGESTLSVNSVEFTTFSCEMAPATELRPMNQEAAPQALKPITPYTGFYPEEHTIFDSEQSYHDQQIYYTTVYPVIYDHTTHEAHIATKLTYTVSWESKGMRRAAPATAQAATTHDALLNNIILNPTSDDDDNATTAQDVTADYLIISITNYNYILRDFINWKRDLGFRVHLETRDSWESDSVVRATINEYYASCPNLRYLLIVGDNDAVPGQLSTHYEPHLTDYYYGYGVDNGIKQLLPNIKRGRIPAGSAAGVKYALDKVMAYEQCKINDLEGRFTNALHCGEFEDKNNDACEDLRLIHTSEEILNNSCKQGMNVSRVYRVCGQNRPMPQYYKDGTPLPTELTDGSFNWFNNADIFDMAPTLALYDEIAKADGYILYLGHGFDSGEGWSQPMYFSVDADEEINKKRIQPVIFSMCCSSGKYDSEYCLARSFTLQQHGGSSCCIAASGTSFSPLTEYMTIGMFDAFSPEALVTTGISMRDKSKYYRPAIRMGDIMDSGLYRMAENCGIWNSARTIYEIFHCFGDPSMMMRTEEPDDISYTASLLGDSNTVRVTVNNGPAYISFYDYKTGDVKCFYGTSADYEFSEIPQYSGFSKITVSAPNKIPQTITANRLFLSPVEFTTTKLGDYAINNNRLHIDYQLSESSEKAFVFLTNAMTGQQVKVQECDIKATSVDVDITNVPSGTYVLSFVVDNSTVDSKTIKI